MKITFLIGNGFDRNLGMATTYSEFINTYKAKPSSNKILGGFRKHIKDNEKLWSAAEVALGQYTNDFEDGQAEVFALCHEDFCKELSTYLKAQEKRIEYDSEIEKIKTAMRKINEITNAFPTEEKQKLDQIYLRRKAEKWDFNFICFNYTSTLDRCVEIAKTDSSVLGSHRNVTQEVVHGINEVCHVHGTVDKEMVFGVNDESQIAKNSIFNCTDGDIYKNLIIKRNANQSYQENTDGKATNILRDSNIIYIYGMSIGKTDQLWWERICNWLESSEEHHLIMQVYELPERGPLPLQYQLAERRAKHLILEYGKYDEQKRDKIAKQVHITSDNIFEDIKGIALSELEIDTKHMSLIELLEAGRSS